MILSILAVVIGLVVLVWSADRFVDGAVGVAQFLGMSTFLIGMLVVGFGLRLRKWLFPFYRR